MFPLSELILIEFLKKKNEGEIVGTSRSMSSADTAKGACDSGSDQLSKILDWGEVWNQIDGACRANASLRVRFRYISLWYKGRVCNKQ